MTQAHSCRRTDDQLNHRSGMSTRYTSDDPWQRILGHSGT